MPDILGPGLHSLVDEPIYRAHPALAQSDLSSWVTQDKPRGRALIIGRAFHELLQLPDYAKKHYARMDTTPDLRKKEGKAELAEFEEKTGKVALRASEYALLGTMVRAVREHPKAGKILEAEGEIELTAIADLHGTGVPLSKGLLDKVLPGKAIVDWKSTGCVSPEQFKESIYKFRYNVQGAYYRDLYNACTGEWLPFIWVCVSKNPPYECWVERLQPEQYVSGAQWYKAVLSLYARYGVKSEA